MNIQQASKLEDTNGTRRTNAVLFLESSLHALVLSPISNVMSKNKTYRYGMVLVVGGMAGGCYRNTNTK